MAQILGPFFGLVVRLLEAVQAACEQTRCLALGGILTKIA